MHGKTDGKQHNVLPHVIRYQSWLHGLYTIYGATRHPSEGPKNGRGDIVLTRGHAVSPLPNSYMYKPLYGYICHPLLLLSFTG